MQPLVTDIDGLATELFEKARDYAPRGSIPKLKRAYEFAKQAHNVQMRKSGEPYIIHPVRTAIILCNLHADPDTLVATLLHDVPEDTKVPLAQINKKFGKKVAYLVDGITKLAKVHYQEKMEQRQIESLKKLFIHSAQDIRVILIKLADRLDNMRTLRFIAEEKKRLRIARETLEVYVPIANLLGIGEIRTELEDLCFEHINSAEFANVKKLVEEQMEERKFVLEEIMHITEKELQKYKMEAEIIGRQKTYYSIYRKLQANHSIHSMEDLVAIRIIVPTRQDCYETMGIIHRLFKPKSGRVKDYIALPKPNGYQSLHTTVFGIYSNVAEFQIRTRYMHLEAEYGVAAHYFYKYFDEKELSALMKQRSSWIQRILEMQKDNTDFDRFMENLKLDVFQDRIFVFSPKGDVIDLPSGASAIDYAYAIHPDIGTHAFQADINGTVWPMNTILTTGDTVQIVTKKDRFPKREWLQYAKTSLAIAKIKEYLKNMPIEKKLEIGKALLKKEFSRADKDFINGLNAKRLQKIFEKTSFKTLDEILIAVNEGEITPQEILETIYETNQLETLKRKTGFMSRVGLRILGNNSKNQFREILRTLNALHIPIVKFITDSPWYLNYDRCYLSVLVKNYKELAQVFESIEQLDGVQKISRLLIRRKVLFIFSATVTALFWIIHPYFINQLVAYFGQGAIISHAIISVGFIMLLGLVFHLKGTARRSFPELLETKYYWPILYGITTLALSTIIAEVRTFELVFNPYLGIGIIIGVYALLTANYLNYRKEQFGSSK